MPYTDKFVPTDNLITQLSPIIAAVTDPGVKVSYAGFLSVSAITVYELAIKDVFIDFSVKKNGVFGFFIEKHFAKLNGRILFGELRGTHIKQFGDRYLKKFDKEFDKKERAWLTRTPPVSLKAQYNNLILCRHQFVHGGTPTLTINEVIDAYNQGKEVIHCLNSIMKR
jgi:hypothetical protein